MVHLPDSVDGIWRRAVTDQTFSIDEMIEALIEREGGYVYHPADKGGPT